eukprot:TRINITY_DN1127_c1_g1_i1.p1 TRINITY_DN1127_c1_g1~~TRINITY_DN1127_c1_g1_i1.p1  ORF type:complete len:274 (+),score=80.40 TRINITY_DN1127_c1_g1_i1:187-1008(+)
MKRVLVVGDGDLSYSAALAEKKKGEVEVWGSVLPCAEEQRRLYGTGVCAEREARVAACGGRVQYETDCTQMEKRFPAAYEDHPFDEVHFNFPHLGYSQQAERGGKWSRAQTHVDFFGKMFKSLAHVQRTHGVMKLTLTLTPPYSVNDVKKVAIEAGYAYVADAPFDPADYAGYHPAWGDDRDLSKHGTSQYGAKGGRTLSFVNCVCRPCGLWCKGTAQIEQHLASSRHDRIMRKQRAAVKRAAAPDAEDGEKGAAPPPAKRRKRAKRGNVVLV